jgi:N-acetylmuramoyl-L-alanine amidase
MTMLKIGARGAAVRELQRLLNAQTLVGMVDLIVDGDYGRKTEAAVRTFQEGAGLVIDGIVGPQTRTALRQAATPAKPGRPEPDKSAMAAPVSASGTGAVSKTAAPLVDIAASPPNAASLVLLDTARPIRELIWHCSATPEGKDFTVADIRAWHKARGWSDIGYHYVVYRDGRIMPGRPVGQVGSHVAGHNTGTVGCCYIGGVTADGSRAKDTRTAAQRASMLWLTEQLIAKHPIKRVSGHNQFAAKACPSFDVRQDALGKLL